MSAITKGDLVSMHYTGKLQDGEVFDSSNGGEPLEFTAGGQDLIPGMSNGVLGMKVGEKKTLTIPANEGYGDHNPDLIHQMPRANAPAEAKVGDQFMVRGPGVQIPVVVTKITDSHITIDANHPLAGKTLVFDVEIVRIDAGKGDLNPKHSCGCGDGGCGSDDGHSGGGCGSGGCGDKGCC
jgi:peptidylprolyl isomerase